MFDHSFPACTFFCFVFWNGVSSCTLVPLFMPGSVHSGSASWDDHGQMFPDKLRVNSFLDRFPHYFWIAAVSPLQLCRVKGVYVFKCNLPPALLAEWPGSFTCRCSNTGVELTPNKSQHSLERKLFPLLLPEFELSTFQSQIRCSYLHAIPSCMHFMERDTTLMDNPS